MPDRYFDKFPIVSYANTMVVGITERVAMLNSVSVNPYIYYPYDIDNYERADQFAARYYDDSFKSWILYLTNGVMDPLREWYYQSDELNQFVTLKYGSVQTAIEKVKFYRNSYDDSDPIMVNAYDALTPLLQEYWDPVYTGNKITSYARRPVDWTLNTNRILQYSLANTSFTVDEIATVHISANAVGSGQVLAVEANSIFVQHVSGVYIEDGVNLLTSNSYVYGHESKVNTAFAMANSTYVGSVVSASNLAPEEEVYWTSVSYYDYENERNEFNKTIRVLDSQFASAMVSDLTNELKD